MTESEARSVQLTLLIVEDDPVLLKRICSGLSDDGYRVLRAATLESARRWLEQSNIDLVLLDIGLPDGSGFEFLRHVRELFPGLPVIILTARSGTGDKVMGLDLGADDYLVKPFDFHELLARVRARLRGRMRGTADALVITVHDLRIDLARRQVHRGSRLIECTPMEFDVLTCLAHRQGMPVSRQVLAAEVWKVQSRLTSLDNVIDVLFSRLRDKVDGPEPVRLIRTVRGRGYMLKPPPAE